MPRERNPDLPGLDELATENLPLRPLIERQIIFRCRVAAKQSTHGSAA